MSTYKSIYKTVVSAGLLLFALLALHGPCLRADAPPPPVRTASLMAIAPIKPIKMPIEVMGPDGITQTVSVALPSGPPAVTLWIQAHGLTYEGKASVRVGSGPWAALTNLSVQVAEPGRSYGGIGGAFGTLKLTLPVPQGAVAGGRTIPITFRFNGTDGTSIGFRILKFNLLAADGTPLLPSATFYQDDPKNWTPPFPDAANIQAGKVLWKSAPLVQSDTAGAPPIQAVCADCHTQDGSDLKYFNFSNYSIIQRARFHGLTHTQARQIASYIRTLNVPNPGRPWNPPFQPGPGLDARPANEWAAGAGLDAVLDKDADMLPFLFPHGISKAAVATSGTLNMRELPVALQLLDWNRWLPTIHPKDAWGADFAVSPFATTYTDLRTRLSGPGGAAFVADRWSGLANYMGFWDNMLWQFRYPRTEAPGLTWTPDYARRVYSLAQWQTVKTWELMQEFGLNDKAPVIYGAGAESRSWLGFAVFGASPNMLHIPEAPGLLTSDMLHYQYLANAWYYTGIVTNSGNRHRSGFKPVDWGYVPGRMLSLSQETGVPQMLRLTAVLVKGMQQADTDGNVDGNGWQPHWSGNISVLVYPEAFGPLLNEPLGPTPDADAQNRAQVLGAVAGAWLDKSAQFAPQQYYLSGQTSQTETLGNTLGTFNMLTATYRMIPNLRAAGVDDALLGAMADWGKTMWPAQNWNALKQ